MCMCVFIFTYISENQNLRIHRSNKILFEIISYYSDYNFHCPKPTTMTGWMRFVIWPEYNMETQVELLKGTDSLKTAHFKWSCPKRRSNNMGISFRSWVYPSRVTSISMSSWLEDCLVTHTKWIGTLLFGGLCFFLCSVIYPYHRQTQKNTGKKHKCCFPRLMQGLGDC